MGLIAVVVIVILVRANRTGGAGSVATPSTGAVSAPAPASVSAPVSTTNTATPNMGPFAGFPRRLRPPDVSGRPTGATRDTADRDLEPAVGVRRERLRGDGVGDQRHNLEDVDGRIR